LMQMQVRNPMCSFQPEACVANILVCDDVRSICEMLDIMLRKEGHNVETTNSGEIAMRKLDSARFDLLICDIRMPNISGIDVLRHARTASPETAVILITAVEDYEAAIQALKAGAFDYIHKGPGLIEELKHASTRAFELLSLRRQNTVYRRDSANRQALDSIIGCSSAIASMKATIRAVAPTNSTVLIQGESGTGKELVARAVHACSPRAAEPFVSINCGAFPETLLESELFGYVKGAFTGAAQNRAGLFETANGGTIFLDEIGEMSLTMQVKLLRVLQERVVRPVGSTNEIHIDVRVIAATNRLLTEMVAANEFRDDLYYRINVIPIDVPPLRDRVEDIPFLANHFLKIYSRAAGRNIFRISDESTKILLGYDWPGNVRQLENTIERAVAFETDEDLNVQLPAERRMKVGAGSGVSNGVIEDVSNGADGVRFNSIELPNDGFPLERYLADLERHLLQAALKQSGGVQIRAAELLKLSYRSFRHLMKKYDI
jgi:two-component system response regulator PilR (NtrC family)